MSKLIFILCVFFIQSAISFDLGSAWPSSSSHLKDEVEHKEEIKPSKADSSEKELNSQDFENDIELIDQVPVRNLRKFYIDSQWNEPRKNIEICNNSVLTLEHILNIILDLVLNTLPKEISVSNLLDVINAYKNDIPVDSQDAELYSKLQQVIQHFGYNQEFPDDNNLRSIKNTDSDTRTRVIFKHKLLKIEEQQCKKVFLGLIGVAYKSYLKHAEYENCEAPNSNEGPVDDQYSKVEYQLLLEQLKPYIIPNPRAVYIHNILQRYRPCQVFQIPGVPVTNSNRLDALLQEILILQNNKGNQPWRLNTNYPGIIKIPQKYNGFQRFPFSYPRSHQHGPEYQESFNNIKLVRPPQRSTWNSVTNQGITKLPSSYQINELKSNIPWQNQHFNKGATGKWTNSDSVSQEEFPEITENRFQKSKSSSSVTSSPLILTDNNRSQLADQKNLHNDITSYANLNDVQNNLPSETLLREEERNEYQQKVTSESPNTRTTYQTKTVINEDSQTADEIPPTVETNIRFLPPQHNDNSQNLFDNTQHRHEEYGPENLNISPAFNIHNQVRHRETVDFEDVRHDQFPSFPKRSQSQNQLIAHYKTIPASQSEDLLTTHHKSIPNIEDSASTPIPFNIRFANPHTAPNNQIYPPQQVSLNQLLDSDITPLSSSHIVKKQFKYNVPSRFTENNRINTVDISQLLQPLEHPPEAVKLTYMVRITPPVYQPYYYVTYTIPYSVFINNIHGLLVENPSLKLDTDKLLQEVIAVSNITAISPDLKYLPQQNGAWNIEDGRISLVNAIPTRFLRKHDNKQVQVLISKLKRSQDLPQNENSDVPYLRLFQTQSAHSSPQYYEGHNSDSSYSARSKGSNSSSTKDSETTPLKIPDGLKQYQQNSFEPHLANKDHLRTQLTGNLPLQSQLFGLGQLQNEQTFSSQTGGNGLKLSERPVHSHHYGQNSQLYGNWAKQSQSPGVGYIGDTQIYGNRPIQGKLFGHNNKERHSVEHWPKQSYGTGFGQVQISSAQLNRNWLKQGSPSEFRQVDNKHSQFFDDWLKNNQANGFKQTQNKDTANERISEKWLKNYDRENPILIGQFGNGEVPLEGKEQDKDVSKQNDKADAGSEVGESWPIHYESNPYVSGQSQYGYQTIKESPLISKRYQQDYGDNGYAYNEFLEYKGKRSGKNISETSVPSSENQSTPGKKYKLSKLKGSDVKVSLSVFSDNEEKTDLENNKNDSEDQKRSDSDFLSVEKLNERKQEATTSTDYATVPVQVKSNVDITNYFQISTTTEEVDTNTPPLL